MEVHSLVNGRELIGHRSVQEFNTLLVHVYLTFLSGWLLDQTLRDINRQTGLSLFLPIALKLARPRASRNLPQPIKANNSDGILLASRSEMS